MTKSVNIIGSGIIGLAFARAFAKKGYVVNVFERNEKASGSSIRNFGMVWPIGQHKDGLLNRAMRTREIWKEVGDEAKIWYKETGSLQLLCNPIEISMGQEFFDAEKDARPNLEFYTLSQVQSKVPFINKQHVRGALFSPTEIIVEARSAIREIPDYLQSKFQANFHFNTTIKECHGNTITTNFGKQFSADFTIIASGYETQLLFPEIFAAAPITISSLNMLRSHPISDTVPALCAGLSFLHYPSYEVCKSMEEYRTYCQSEFPLQIQNGVHLLVSQNPNGQLTIGDSHHYGMHHDPFQSDTVDQSILDYMDRIIQPIHFGIAQRWTGQYLKLTNGKSEWFEEIAPGTYIANGPGGAGMTLGWGMAEEFVQQIVGI